jgi:hypothetical protein
MQPELLVGSEDEEGKKGRAAADFDEEMRPQLTKRCCHCCCCPCCCCCCHQAKRARLLLLTLMRRWWMHWRLRLRMMKMKSLKKVSSLL